jgi:hypothetical protein
MEPGGIIASSSMCFLWVYKLEINSYLFYYEL